MLSLTMFAVHYNNTLTKTIWRTIMVVD